MTTITEFYNELAAVSVTGVKRKWAQPPRQITTADLPAQWAQLPTGGLSLDSSEATVCDDSGKTRTLIMVIATEAAGQGTNPTNTIALLAMMDAVEDALDETYVGRIDYVLTPSQIVLSDTPYWGFTAQITLRF